MGKLTIVATLGVIALACVIAAFAFMVHGAGVAAMSCVFCSSVCLALGAEYFA